MPYIETPEELAEWFADRVGIYGAHDEKCDGGLKKDMCRVCWVPMIADRIRQSVANQEKLKANAGPNNCPQCGQFFDSMGELCDGCAKRNAGLPSDLKR